MTCKRWVGVHTGGAHYLDHLGILCQGLAIPLLVTERSTLAAAQEFYPRLDVRFMEISELSLDFLAQQVDVIFESGHFFASELIPLWELLYGKKMRVVYCPHGNSDKKSPPLRKDLSLVYGDYMKDHLEKTGENLLLEGTVMTGNYRALDYSTHQPWYDAKLASFLQGRIDPSRKTIFYAPTWEGKGWFEKSLKVIRETRAGFNLLIRLHPFLEDLYPQQTLKIKREGGIDLSGFPSIYPILQVSDMYVGDFSSIGYDFLLLDKPLFFMSSGEGEIYHCGVTLQENSHYGKAIDTLSDHSFWSERRKILAGKVFGEKKSFKEIKKLLEKALSYDRASWI